MRSSGNFDVCLNIRINPVYAETIGHGGIFVSNFDMLFEYRKRAGEGVR